MFFLPLANNKNVMVVASKDLNGNPEENESPST